MTTRWNAKCADGSCCREMYELLKTL